MAEAGLSLGSNLGDKAAMIGEALLRLNATAGIGTIRRSRLYRTEPWGDRNQDWFLNACAIVETSLSPRALLERCLAIETELGRDRSESRKWGPRPIDIDILFYDDVELAEAGLILPHPYLFERAFVLAPLSEIAGDRTVKGRSIADAARAAGTSGITIWDPDL
jgi:2-amino-4-hydroxy-6-hydroxymethyldihydropteridine diphosphokinase